MHESGEHHIHQRILEDNEQLASENLNQWNARGTLTVNFMSAPGAGKTTLIVEIARRLKNDHSLCVIEGDMVGDLDAQRIRETGVPSFQITTGRSCHLDAAMIARLLHTGSVPVCDAIFIENVGNLVCPAEFPLGEHLRIVLLSVTEGDDKPLKYPVIFHHCDAVLLTKTDLLEHVEFDVERVTRAINGVNPDAKLFCLSSKTGNGLDDFIAYIENALAHRSVRNTSPNSPSHELSST